MIRQCRCLLAGALVALGAVPGVALAQGTTGTTGTITGRVTDAATKQPLVAVTVVVTGTTRGTVTAQGGTFRIVGVNPGTVQLRAQRIGYQASTQPVTVTAGAEATVEFALAAAATTLDQVVVTATGAQQRAREQGSNVAQIRTDSIALAAVPSFSTLVGGRAAGVTVTQSGGTTGGGARVRIRGANSVSLSNEPLLIIDGVRVNNTAESNTIGVGGQSQSRLNDIKPEDVESIEILKGPAATGLYGTQAANGVIQVTTKRGRAGQTRWNVFSELGSIEDTYQDEYPNNYAAYGRLTRNDSTILNCRLSQTVATGTTRCVQDSVQAYTPLRSDASPFRTGFRQKIGASVGGGNQNATYFISADNEREKGIYETNELGRTNLRLNLSATPRQDLTTSLSTGFLNSNSTLPQNDNNTLGLISGALLGGAFPCSQATPCGTDTTSRGYFAALTPRQLAAIQVPQNLKRYIASSNTTYTPLDWLSVNATLGLDLLNRDDQSFTPPNRITTSAAALEGSRSRNRFNIANYTANTSATGTYNFRENITSQTVVGVQYQNEQSEGNRAFGARLLEGTESLDGANARFAVGEDNLYARQLGVLVQEQLGFNDRLFLTGAVRGDRNSAFGQNFKFAYYPSGQLSWVVSEEPFFPESRYVSSIKLRAAVGQSGLRPGLFDALQYFDPVAATVNNVDAPAFQVGGAGNPELKPERTTEYEGGVDLGFFNGRLNLDATYFAKTSRDALISRRLAPSLGSTTTRFDNLGSVTNKGLELLASARIVETDAVKFGTTVNFATLSNKLTELGAGIEPVIFGLGGASQRHAGGFPLGHYFQRGYTFADANNNNVIETAEVTLDSAPSFRGTIFPRRTLSVQPELTLFDVVRVNALVDYRGGYKQLNYTEAFRCNTTATCQALYDPSSSLADQARAVAALNGSISGFIEDGTFTRLREVAVTLSLPQTLAQRFNSRGLSLTLAGRNLATWTDYSGTDPEVNFAGQANFSSADFLTQPPIRYFTARLNVDF